MKNEKIHIKQSSTTITFEKLVKIYRESLTTIEGLLRKGIESPYQTKIDSNFFSFFADDLYLRRAFEIAIKDALNPMDLYILWYLITENDFSKSSEEPFRDMFTRQIKIILAAREGSIKIINGDKNRSHLRPKYQQQHYLTLIDIVWFKRLFSIFQYKIPESDRSLFDINNAVELALADQNRYFKFLVELGSTEDKLTAARYRLIRESGECYYKMILTMDLLNSRFKEQYEKIKKGYSEVPATFIELRTKISNYMLLTEANSYLSVSLLPMSFSQVFLFTMHILYSGYYLEGKKKVSLMNIFLQEFIKNTDIEQQDTDSNDCYSTQEEVDMFCIVGDKKLDITILPSIFNYYSSLLSIRGYFYSASEENFKEDLNSRIGKMLKKNPELLKQLQAPTKKSDKLAKEVNIGNMWQKQRIDGFPRRDDFESSSGGILSQQLKAFEKRFEKELIHLTNLKQQADEIFSKEIKKMVNNFKQFREQDRFDYQLEGMILCCSALIGFPDDI